MPGTFRKDNDKLSERFVGGHSSCILNTVYGAEGNNHCPMIFRGEDPSTNRYGLSVSQSPKSLKLAVSSIRCR